LLSTERGLQNLAAMSALARLCENSDVQLACRISVSISSMQKPNAPAASVGRRQLRKQFCASFVQARFHSLGQSRHTGYRPTTSALPRRTDIGEREHQVRKVPGGDIRNSRNQGSVKQTHQSSLPRELPTTTPTGSRTRSRVWRHITPKGSSISANPGG
jgi:hypothetical protein